MAEEMESEEKLEKANKELEKLRKVLKNKDKDITNYLKKLDNLHDRVLNLTQNKIESENTKTNWSRWINIIFLLIIGGFFAYTYQQYHSGQEPWLYIISSLLFSIVAIIAIKTNLELSSDV